MNYTNTQLDIIRTFGSKELSEGCIVKYKWVYEKVVFYNLEDERLLLDIGQYEADRQDIEIIWHIPHLFPDVARVAEEKGKHMEVRTMIYDRIEFSVKENPYPICIPYNPTISFLEQSEETLTKLLNIFKPS